MLRASATTGNAEDDPLVRSAQRDPAAFWLLYERHGGDLYRYLRARSRRDEDAADLTASTFERAFKALAGYQPERAPGGFGAWLFGMALNAAIDASRGRGPSDRLEVHEDLAAPEWTDPEWSALEAEQKAELRARINALAEPQRDAITLRYAGGLTAREIGVVLGKSEEASQKLITRALAQLRESYGAR